jgi:NADPH2:quinone reductase
MKAAVLHKFGDSPRYEEFPDPVPTEGQMLVEVVASALGTFINENHDE